MHIHTYTCNPSTSPPATHPCTSAFGIIHHHHPPLRPPAPVHSPLIAHLRLVHFAAIRLFGLEPRLMVSCEGPAGLRPKDPGPEEPGPRPGGRLPQLIRPSQRDALRPPPFVDTLMYGCLEAGRESRKSPRGNKIFHRGISNPTVFYEIPPLRDLMKKTLLKHSQYLRPQG